jgi:hypothetical protein
MHVFVMNQLIGYSFTLPSFFLLINLSLRRDDAAAAAAER